MSIRQKHSDKSKAVMAGWNFRYDTLPYYGKTPKGDGVSEDRAAENDNLDALCLVYTVLEIGMGRYFGHIAVIRNKKDPVLQAVFTYPHGTDHLPVFSRYSNTVYFETHSGLLIYDIVCKKYTLYSCKMCDIGTLKEYTDNTFTIDIYGDITRIDFSALDWHDQQGTEINIKGGNNHDT